MFLSKIQFCLVDFIVGIYTKLDDILYSNVHSIECLEIFPISDEFSLRIPVVHKRDNIDDP